MAASVIDQGGDTEAATEAAVMVVAARDGSVIEQAQAAGSAVALAGGTNLEAGAAAAEVAKAGGLPAREVQRAAGRAACYCEIAKKHEYTGMSAQLAAKAAVAQGATHSFAMEVAGESAGAASVAAFLTNLPRYAGRSVGAAVMRAGGTVDEAARGAGLTAIKCGAPPEVANDIAKIVAREAAALDKERFASKIRATRMLFRSLKAIQLKILMTHLRRFAFHFKLEVQQGGILMRVARILMIAMKGKQYSAFTAWQDNMKQKGTTPQPFSPRKRPARNLRSNPRNPHPNPLTLLASPSNRKTSIFGLEINAFRDESTLRINL